MRARFIRLSYAHALASEESRKESKEHPRLKEGSWTFQGKPGLRTRSKPLKQSPKCAPSHSQCVPQPPEPLLRSRFSKTDWAPLGRVTEPSPGRGRGRLLFPCVRVCLSVCWSIRPSVVRPSVCLSSPGSLPSHATVARRSQTARGNRWHASPSPLLCGDGPSASLSDAPRCQLAPHLAGSLSAAGQSSCPRHSRQGGYRECRAIRPPAEAPGPSNAA